MPVQTLYRKWRPQLWDEVVGQEHVIQTLRNALRAGRLTHAYLFAGPRGCGKTTTARLVAKALNCLHTDPAQRPDNTCDHCVTVNEGRFLDLIEIDGASNNGVENIRELRDKINFAPSQGRYKVYIIDEVHMLSIGAFNALLKTLEEPPAHAVFILATTENYKIPATVSSRCQRFEFRRIPVAEIVARLKTLCEQEKLTVEEAALEIVARQATGSLRDAISLLDQLVAADPTVSLAEAQALLGTAAGQVVQDLVDALAAGETTAGLTLINSAVDAGVDPRQLARQMVDYLRSLMLVRLGNAQLVEVTAEMRATMARQAEKLELSSLLRALRAFTVAANDVKGGWQPQLPLELAIVECTAPLPIPAPELAAPAPTVPTAKLATPVPEALKPDPTSSARKKPAPTAPPASKVSETPKASGAPAGNYDVKAVWTRLLTMMREKDKPTTALLRSCTVLGLEGNTLLVATNEFVYKQINDRAETRTIINDVLTQTVGFPCMIQCQLTGAVNKRSPEASDLPADGMVATALRDLGGEIVE